MKKVVRLLAILIVLLAASAVPSSAIIPHCWEFCSCEVGCDWGCWDRDTSSGTNCGDWGLCSGSGVCSASAASGKVYQSQSAWLESLRNLAGAPVDGERQREDAPHPAPSTRP